MLGPAPAEPKAYGSPRASPHNGEDDSDSDAPPAPAHPHPDDESTPEGYRAKLARGDGTEHDAKELFIDAGEGLNPDDLNYMGNLRRFAHAARLSGLGALPASRAPTCSASPSVQSPSVPWPPCSAQRHTPAHRPPALRVPFCSGGEVLTHAQRMAFTDGAELANQRHNFKLDPKVLKVGATSQPQRTRGREPSTPIPPRTHAGPAGQAALRGLRRHRRPAQEHAPRVPPVRQGQVGVALL